MLYNVVKSSVRRVSVYEWNFINKRAKSKRRIFYDVLATFKHQEQKEKVHALSFVFFIVGKYYNGCLGTWGSAAFSRRSLFSSEP